MRDVLIVIDMQNDFIDGSLGTPEAQAIVPKVKEKIEKYKEAGKDVIFTKDTHFENYLDTFEGKNLPVEHCIKGTEGWEINKELNTKVHTNIIHKRTFGYLDWDIHIDDNKTIEIIGLCTDICVVSNALILRAIFPNNIITVDASCCAGVTPEKHKAALEVMKSCQIEVINK